MKLEWADSAAVQEKCGNISGNELTCNLSGNIQPQSSLLAEPLWTDPGIKCGIRVHKLISNLKKKKCGGGGGGERMVEFLPKSSQARKRLPPPPFNVQTQVCCSATLTLHWPTFCPTSWITNCPTSSSVDLLTSPSTDSPTFCPT